MKAKRVLRWYVKKVARYCVAFLSWGCGWLYLSRLIHRRPRVRVLMYHRFRTAPHDPFSVPIPEFTRQMEWIAQKRLAVSLGDLQDFISGKKTLRDGAVLVSVDDGYHDFWSKALPVLQRLRIPAVVFVPVGKIIEKSDAENGDHVSQDDQMLGWEEIIALAKSDVAVGSHAWNHSSLGCLEKDSVHFEADQSRKVLEARLGSHILAFAYPFGTCVDFNAITKSVLRQAGYEYAFTAQHGAIRQGADPYSLPRIKVEGGDGLRLFKMLLRGALDPWRIIDRFFWRFQQNRSTEGGGLSSEAANLGGCS